MSKTDENTRNYARRLANVERNHATRYQQGDAYFNAVWASGVVPACSPGYISGVCDGGHKYAAPYLCGKETCRDCGRDGSPIHKRRISKWMPLVRSFTNLGYFVFTFPDYVRFLFNDVERLTRFRFYLRRKLQRYGFNKGLARFHWFGDCEYCDAAGCNYCNNTGAGTKFHPHLNILVDCGYIKPEKLAAFNEDFGGWARNYVAGLLREEMIKRRAMIKKYGPIVAGMDGVFNEFELLKSAYQENKLAPYVIHYSYIADCNNVNQLPKTINRVKYILRSTFRVYNKEVKQRLHNFRNSIRWGFGKTAAESEPVYCEVCKGKGLKHVVKWIKLKPYVNQLNTIHNGKGVYRIETRGRPTQPGKETDSRRRGKLDAIPGAVTLRAGKRSKAFAAGGFGAYSNYGRDGTGGRVSVSG